MAKKEYRFPNGIQVISKKEMQNALCNYERVIIPGSVLDVKINATDYINDVVAKEIKLDEGVQALEIHGYKEDADPIRYNIPNTLYEIQRGLKIGPFSAPRVALFPPTFRVGHRLTGMEYLQAYSSSEIRYSDFSQLKHYVYLGDKMSPKLCLFDGLMEGCVVHVQNKKMALSVLKRVNVLRVYVVPDADEWKDFPADKLALTPEQYNAEARMLPEQIKMREERLQKIAEQQRKDEEDNIRRSKEKHLEEMITMAIEPAIKPEVYSMKIDMDLEKNNNTIAIKVSVWQHFWAMHWNDDLYVTICVPVDMVLEHVDKMVQCIRDVKALLQQHQDWLSQHRMGDNYCRDAYAYISLPRCGSNRSVDISLNQNCLETDAQTAIRFVEKINALFYAAMQTMPGCTITW